MSSENSYRSQSPEGAEDFPLILEVPENLVRCFTEKEVTQRIVEESKVEGIRLADSPGYTIMIIDAFEIPKKMYALQQVLEEFSLNDYDIKSQGITIRIPTHMVSLLIGRHGSQIKQFQDRSFTDISVLEKRPQLEHRQIKVKGAQMDIITAVESIQGLIKDRFNSAEFKNPTREKSYVQFIVPNNSVGVLIGKAGNFTKNMKTDFNVEIKVLRGDGRNASEYEHIAVRTK